MKLKEYQQEDSAIICSWIKDEKSLYQWSANRIGKFPLSGNELNEEYAPMLKSGRFVPLNAFDDKGKLVGYLYIRYPDEADNRQAKTKNSVSGKLTEEKIKFL